ncbi:MAG TPA: hypothetical protein VGE55_01740 [Limnobacter sp.]|uniref:hypothetical protein n=1 Tax=Limnobacter sp. TaxID=2003368 RepID=UPI002ED77324
MIALLDIVSGQLPSVSNPAQSLTPNERQAVVDFLQTQTPVSGQDLTDMDDAALIDLAFSTALAQMRSTQGADPATNKPVELDVSTTPTAAVWMDGYPNGYSALPGLQVEADPLGRSDSMATVDDVADSVAGPPALPLTMVPPVVPFVPVSVPTVLPNQAPVAESARPVDPVLTRNAGVEPTVNVPVQATPVTTLAPARPVQAAELDVPASAAAEDAVQLPTGAAQPVPRVSATAAVPAQPVAQLSLYTPAQAPTHKPTQTPTETAVVFAAPVLKVTTNASDAVEPEAVMLPKPPVQAELPGRLMNALAADAPEPVQAPAVFTAQSLPAEPAVTAAVPRPQPNTAAAAPMQPPVNDAPAPRVELATLTTAERELQPPVLSSRQRLQSASVWVSAEPVSASTLEWMKQSERFSRQLSANPAQPDQDHSVLAADDAVAVPTSPVGVVTADPAVSGPVESVQPGVSVPRGVTSMSTVPPVALPRGAGRAEELITVVNDALKSIEMRLPGRVEVTLHLRDGARLDLLVMAENRTMRLEMNTDRVGLGAGLGDGAQQLGRTLENMGYQLQHLKFNGDILVNSPSSGSDAGTPGQGQSASQGQTQSQFNQRGEQGRGVFHQPDSPAAADAAEAPAETEPVKASGISLYV